MKYLRQITLGSMIVSTTGLLAFTGWQIGRPLWKRHQAVTRLLESVESEIWILESYSFEDPVDDVKKWGGDEWAVAALVRRLEHPNDRVRWSAAHVLQRFGGTSRPAISILVGFLDGPDDDLRHQAAQTLASIGKDAVPQLIPRLDDGRQETRIAAAEALGGMGPAAETAIPALVRMLNDAEYNIFRTAEDTLPNIGRPVIPTILLHLKLPDTEPGEDMRGGRCSWAIRAIIEIGPDSKEAIPLLVDLLHDGRRAEPVGEALARIGPNGIVALKNALRGATPQIHADALHGVANVFDACPEAVQFAIESLNAESPSVREWALIAISVFGNRAHSFQPALDRLLADTDPKVRAAAAKAHWRVYGQSEPVLHTLIDVLKSNHARAQYEAANALGELGPRGAEGVPALIGLFSSPDHFTRCAACYALRGIAARPEIAIPPLIEALKDREVRHAAGEALAAYGTQAKQAVPSLLQTWRQARLENSWWDASELAKSIERISPQIKLKHHEISKPVDAAAIVQIEQEVSRALALTEQSESGK